MLARLSLLLAVQAAEAKDLGLLLQNNVALRLELAATRARVAGWRQSAAKDLIIEKHATAFYIVKYLSKSEAAVSSGRVGGRSGHSGRGGGGGRGGRGVGASRYSFPVPAEHADVSEC